MTNYTSNQMTLDLVFETRPAVAKSTYKPNPFTISERVKRILFKMGYSHIFNYPDYKEFKALATGLTGAEQAQFIAELFIENTSEKSDFQDYVN